MIDLLESIIKNIKFQKNEFLDLRGVEQQGTVLDIQNGRVANSLSFKEKGVATRALVNGGWGFSFTNNLTKAAILETIRDTIRMAKKIGETSKITGRVVEAGPYSSKKARENAYDVLEIGVDQKLKLMLKAEKQTRKLGKEIATSVIRYNDMVHHEYIVNTFGTNVTNQSIYATFGSIVTAVSDGVKQTCANYLGNTTGWMDLIDNDPIQFSIDNGEKAIAQSHSKPVKPGRYNVVLDPHIVGLFVHEAFGHSVEADSVIQGMSILADKIGKKIGNDKISIIEDPTMPGSFGSYQYDSEGTPARKRILVKNGELVDFLYSLESAALLGKSQDVLNGAARASNYKQPPLVRMSNTYLGPGSWHFDEIIEDTNEGLYLRSGLYGYTYPVKGEFLFNAQEVFEIKNGEIRNRLQQTNISGLVLEVMNNVSAIGNDLKMADPGFCGKQGQSIRVDDGGPHVRVNDLVVGGRQ